MVDGRRKRDEKKGGKKVQKPAKKTILTVTKIQTDGYAGRKEKTEGAVGTCGRREKWKAKAHKEDGRRPPDGD